MGRKLSVSELEKRFSKYGWKLLERKSKGVEYSYKAKCPCGNVTRKTPRTFPSRLRCKLCSNRKKARNMRIPYNQVKEVFEENGIQLISKEYKNSRTLLECICACGRKAFLNYGHVKNGGLCQGCMYDRNGRRKYTYKEAVAELDKIGISLISKGEVYMNSGVDYICECGRKGYSIFANILNGVRCEMCTIEKYSGENHPNYNAELTSEERARDRIDVISSRWSYRVRKRDEFACQICSKNQGTVAHHIFSYGEYPKLRTELSNGVTLCEDCHIDFHRHYGYGENNLDQFITYLMWRWMDGNKNTFIRH